MSNASLTNLPLTACVSVVYRLILLSDKSSSPPYGLPDTLPS